MVNLKILIISGMPIRVIFQNSVTFNTEYVLPSEAEDNPICIVAEEKDLSIVFGGQLKFSSHNQTVAKA